AHVHDEIGDEAFLSFLRSAQGSFTWKFVTTKHLVGLLEHMTQQDFDPFFERYYWGTEMPTD
ncbi:MAG: hypothetical protein AAF560_17015, partial [Acidobacteriota bacterium]